MSYVWDFFCKAGGVLKNVGTFARYEGLDWHCFRAVLWGVVEKEVFWDLRELDCVSVSKGMNFVVYAEIFVNFFCVVCLWGRSKCFP